MDRKLAILAAALAAALPATQLGAQTPLELGAMTESLEAFDESLEYAVEVPAAGFLTVVARSHGGEDIRLFVTDDEHQTLPNGSADMDLGGDLGAEQIVVTLPSAGAYRVFVESYDYVTSGVQIGASFLASEAAASPPDPDGKPSGARSMTPGDEVRDSIEPDRGDAWDWFRIEPKESGVLTVLTRSLDGDLKLELFEEGMYRESVQVSDQDQGGEVGNEAVTIDVVAGVPVFVRVLHSYGGGGLITYRLASGLIPG